MSRNKEPRGAAFGGALDGAAAEGGRPIGGAAEGGASVFFVSAHLSFLYYQYLWIFLIYSLYISYIYIYICPKILSIYFLCIFRNLFSQQISIELFNRRGCSHMHSYLLGGTHLYAVPSLTFERKLSSCH